MILYIAIIGISGLCFGLFLGFISDFIEKRSLLQKAKREAEDILEEAKEKEESLFQSMYKAFEQNKQRKTNQFEGEKERLLKNIRRLQSYVDKASYQSKMGKEKKSYEENKMDKKIIELKRQQKSFDDQFLNTFSKNEKAEQDLIQKILDKFSINISDFKSQLQREMEEKLSKEITLKLEQWSEDKKKNLQKDAWFYLNLALNRFERAYCSERGIELVRFKNASQMKRMIGADRIHLNNLEKECGVDVVVNEEDTYAYVLGIDPVRKELGRMTLHSLTKKKYIDSKTIRKTAEFCKKELFQRIKKDGRMICNRLKIRNATREVQNMMGSLRYRYSFAQNQYFHCEEVAWLCGLLNSELGLSLKSGQRAGLFHDIGKAMDHSIEGSHAVIGADFIQKNNEREAVVHAVRAHHHDETPSTPLAYLVIAADAISGSRPGARRFTEDSYSQKLESLEKIIDSFSNIEDAYIMSAGREMRVIVDNRKIDDQGALELSKEIARKIEVECTYPGLIKVTVVRHSEATAVAQK